jgi:hypothetical protein
LFKDDRVLLRRLWYVIIGVFEFTTR